MRLLLAFAALLLLVLAFAPSAAAENAGIRYRLQVFTGAYLDSGSLPAPDGTRIVVTRLQRPNRDLEPWAQPCAEAVTQGGYAEFQVSTAACPAGSVVGLTLHFAGREPVYASVDETLVWQLAREDDKVHTLVVWPVLPAAGTDVTTQALAAPAEADETAATAATAVPAAPRFSVHATSGIPWPAAFAGGAAFVLAAAGGIWWASRRGLFA